MTDEAALEVLVPFFIDGPAYNFHNGRWDIWLFIHDHLDVLSYIKSMTDQKEFHFIEKTKRRAWEIKHSPLYKALA
jgi:hypothetical protein